MLWPLEEHFGWFGFWIKAVSRLHCESFDAESVMGLEASLRLSRELVGASQTMGVALPLALGLGSFDLLPLLKELIAYLICVR